MELLVGHVLPVAAVEELVLEPAEESLGRGVVRRAALGAHGPGRPVVRADADPPGPSVVAPAVRVNDGMLAVAKRGDRVEQHALAHGRIRAWRQPPRHNHAVEAVDDRRQPALVAVHGELGDVREPQFIRPPGVEVAFHEVGRSQRQLAFVGAPRLGFPQVHGTKPLLAHDAAHDLLRDRQQIRPVPPQHGVDGAVPPHSPALLEQDSDPFAQAGVLVSGLDHRALVVVGAAGQTHGPQNGVEAELIPERVNDPRPLPVRQFGGIVARAVDF